MVSKRKKQSSPKKQNFTVKYSLAVEVQAATEDEAYELAARVLEAEGHIKPQDLTCEGASLTENAKLWAILDDGNMNGDSAYYCPASSVPYRHGMSWDEILGAYRTQLSAEMDEILGAYCIQLSAEMREVALSEDVEETVQSVKVAWIVTDKQKQDLENALPDCGGDSSTYAVNRSMKRVARAFAISTLKR